MDTASGVYLHITDSSFQTSGSSSLKVVIPMLLTKGKIGLNDVDSTTYKDIVGYDLDYNSNYDGLGRILEQFSHAYVWRLNQNAKMANAYFNAFDDNVATDTDVETFEDITKKDPAPVFAAAHKYVGNWATTGIKFAPLASTETVINENPNSALSQKIVFDDISSTEKSTIGEQKILNGCVFYNSSDNSIVGCIARNDDDTAWVVYRVVDGEVVKTVIGTAEFEDTKLTITLTSKMSSDTFWNVHVIPSTITDWTMTYSSYDGRNYTVISTVDFSFDVESDIYYEDVDFGDVQLYFSQSIPSTWEAARNYIMLESGSNGDPTVTATDIDVSALDDVDLNILLFNGLTDYKVVNRIATKCHSKKIHAFADAPAYSSYADLYTWKKKLINSEYLAIAGRPDQQETSDGKTYYVYPSVNYAKIFADMLSNHGSLCYPPAGPSYGTISVDDLLKVDYANFADEMKTNRINWQISDNTGTMMWEQRTNYSLNTDLSYIAPVFIVDDLSDSIIAFERQFNFRYMTKSDLLNQSSGLTDILDGYVTKGFLYSYELDVPSYDEAQKAGRTLTIGIKIVIAKDSEVINIELELTNA